MPPVINILSPGASAPPPFAPTDIAGLQLWLDASQIVGLNDGDPIASWLDKSGNSNNGSQAVAPLKPIYKTNIINGKPVARCAGAAVMGLASPIVLSGAYTLYVVGNRATSQKFVPASEGTSLLTIFSDNNVYIRDDVSATAAVDYAGSAGSILTRFRRSAVGSTNQFRATGMSEANAGVTGTTTLSEVLGQTINAYFTIGDVGDLLLWNVEPTSDELIQIDTYLAAKWGISV